MLAAKPKKGNAVLFHSIKPSGELRLCAGWLVVAFWIAVLFHNQHSR